LIETKEGKKVWYTRSKWC